MDRPDLLLHPQLGRRLDGADGAADVDVPKTKFWGIDRLSTDNLRDSMLASTEAEAVDRHPLDRRRRHQPRQPAQPLPAVDRGSCRGYLPDSNKNSFDKLNVRDGHYPLWGYEHFFTPVGAGGVPSDAAKAFVTRFSIARLDQMLLDNIIAASLVPQCAMKVVRTGEETTFMPQTGLSCGCYFDFKTTGKTTASRAVVVRLPGRSLRLQLRLLRDQLIRYQITRFSVI